jgi:hypothetical protein
MLGQKTGRPDDFCTINTITHGPDGVELLAELNIDVITEEIKACGRCGTCGTKSVKAS